MRFYDKVNRLCFERGISITAMAMDLGISKGTPSNWKAMDKPPRADTIKKVADYFGVSMAYLTGVEENDRLPSPDITTDFVTFPVIGDIAAGYDSIAIENWDGERIDIPASYMAGRKQSEFFVLKVKGDSMYPDYKEGDRVLILKQETLNCSGGVGAILYDDGCATLKRVEFVPGEDWLRLVPINPAVPPKRIEGEALEHCRVIGVPKLLIRILD